MRKIESMLIPRFSIRFLLLVTTVLAGAFLIAAFAYRGHLWAFCVVAGLVSVAVAMLTYAAVFAAIWVATGRFAAERGTGGGTRPADQPTATPSPATEGGQR